MPKGVVPKSAWKKGANPNPNGSSAKSRAIARVKRMNADELAELISMMLEGTMAQAHSHIDDPKASALKAMTARLVHKAHMDGDPKIWSTILDRCIGRVRETKDITVTGADGQPLQMDIREKSSDELRAAVEELRKNDRIVGDD